MTAEAHDGPLRAGQRWNSATADASQTRVAKKKRRRRGLLSSSLTRRILSINLLVLAVPVGGFFFLDQYQQSLINQEIEALRVQGEIFAGALGAGAVVVTPGIGQRLDGVQSGRHLRRLAAPTQTRARLFAAGGELISDTRALASPRGHVHVEELPRLAEDWSLGDWAVGTFDALVNWLPGRRDLPVYRELPVQTARDYDEVRRALLGQGVGRVRDDANGGMVISVAVPVQRYKQIVGALMLSTGSSEIERGLRAVRMDILRVFGVALAVTVLLSLYLAGTIGRPLRRLALAAERVRRGHGRQSEIPDFSERGDEIGELSRDLRQMTTALWERMDAIEHFAADVAHEIKNPLTSLRSAVETVARVTDPEQQRRLMTIILEDVQRLDRLISDISDASRLDAELSRASPEPVDLGRLLTALVDMEQATAKADSPKLTLDMPDGDPLSVNGFEGRLGQVFRNIFVNAASFSPPSGRIACHTRREGNKVVVTIDDEGPGIPPNKLDGIFDRFYSDRPVAEGEKFGTHSGLGLSISRQILEAAGGCIWAENRQDREGRVIGARFVIELPARA
ncbi:MAG: stimulus-sensing domain-containing protein [Alphaproteobacteria bacterium]